MSSSDFSSLSLHANLISNLASLGYESMTPIQAQSLPLILNKKDLIAKAKTGSGKTAAFGLGLLNNLDVSRYRVQTLVLCPTRELADQVAKEIRKLARAIHNIKILTLCGGMPFGPQIHSLEHGAHIIVGTPGRVEEHLRKQHLNLDNLNTFVLDEADRMLDMGFQDTIDTIITYLPAQRQNLLFSATYPDSIEAISKRIMSEPVMVTVESEEKDNTIKQVFYEVANDGSRAEAIYLLLLTHRPSSTVIFCNTKKETVDIANKLRQYGFSALALNGDLDQKMREQVLVRFANKSASVLVATDVAARGLDIEELDAVINVNISRELDVHTHRIGRTGRAGSHGIAYTLVSPKEDYKFESLQKYLKSPFTKLCLPSEEAFKQTPYKASMATLQIDGGKKQKVRAGDILGALTGKGGIDGKQVGKINLFDNCAYVAVSQKVSADALHKLEMGKLKGRSFRVRQIRG